MSSRLWDGSVPNTPIGPPPSQTNKRPQPNWTYTGAVRKAPARPLAAPRNDANPKSSLGHGPGPANAPTGHTGAHRR